MQNLTFKIEFKNVPDSMVTAMAQLEIGDISNTSITFKKELHIDFFTSLCALIKVSNMEKDLKEAIKEAIKESEINEAIY